jgi:hypothetical protein
VKFHWGKSDLERMAERVREMEKETEKGDGWRRIG